MDKITSSMTQHKNSGKRLTRNSEMFSRMKTMIIQLALQKTGGIMHVIRIPIKGDMINRRGKKKLRAEENKGCTMMDQKRLLKIF